MPIPRLNDYGVLPEGIHDCTLEEARARFGTFQVTDRRPRLWSKFVEFVEAAKAAEIVERILLNGSFVTAKADPNDIDLILVVGAEHDFSADLSPREYN